MAHEGDRTVSDSEDISATLFTERGADSDVILKVGRDGSTSSPEHPSGIRGGLHRDKHNFKFPIFGLWPMLQLQLEVAGAVMYSMARRAVLAPKKKEWSASYEMVVSAMRVTLRRAVTSQDVRFFETGTHIERAMVLNKMRDLQNLTNNVPTEMLPGCTMEETRVGQIPARWIYPTSDDVDRKSVTECGCRVVLYLHGGAYMTGGLNSHQRLISKIAQASGLPVFGIEYRKMPHHTFDHILQDAVDGFLYLVENQGYQPAEIAIAGDSAGGHLALSLALHMTKLDPERVPGAVYAISPWLDPMEHHPGSKQSWDSNMDYDYLGTASGALAMPQSCFQGSIYGSLLGLDTSSALKALPRCLIQVGDHECLYGQSVEFSKLAKSAGVDLKLEVYAHQVHVFQAFDDTICPEAAAAVAAAGLFLSQSCSG